MLLLLPLLMASGPPAPTVDMLLEAGRWRVAATLLRQELRVDPSRHELRPKLALALMRSGRCRGALAQLQIAREQGLWSPEIALREGLCYELRGQLSAAEASLFEAEELGDEDVARRARLHRQLVRLHAGDEAVRAEVELEAAETPTALVSLRAAEIVGGLDTALMLWERPLHMDASREVELLRLKTVAALRDGDNAGAELLARQAHTLRPHALGPIALGAEAMRRQGALGRAEQALGAPFLTAVDIVSITAVRARVAADKGDVAQARAQLDLLGEAETRDALLARWVVARRAGDPAAESLAERYRALGYEEVEALERSWTGED